MWTATRSGLLEPIEDFEAVDNKLDDILEKAGWQEHSIFGYFVVCPESQYQPHHEQNVCIQSYKNIRIAKWK